MVLGVDVSQYQPKPDWRQLRIDGRAFAYARTCDGLTEDPLYRTHTVEARVESVEIGGYQLGHPSMDVKACVDFFMGLVSLQQLRPVIDMEALAAGGAVPANAAEWADAWCELVKAGMLSLLPLSAGATRGPLIYASTSYWRTMCVQKPAVAGWDWWAAEYHGNANPSDPMPLGAVAWQYAGNVALSGQAGLWDLDVTPDLDRLRM